MLRNALVALTPPHQAAAAPAKLLDNLLHLPPKLAPIQETINLVKDKPYDDDDDYNNKYNNKYDDNDDKKDYDNNDDNNDNNNDDNDDGVAGGGAAAGQMVSMTHQNLRLC